MDDSVLASLFDLHTRCFQARGLTTLFGIDRLEMHRRLIAHSEAGRGPCALIAEHGGERIGVEYGFWWRNVYASVQGGWDPAWARWSPGRIMMAELVRRVLTEGAMIVDFLGGVLPEKYDLGAKDRWDEGWLLPNGVSGRMLALAAWTKVQLKRPWVRPFLRLGKPSMRATTAQRVLGLRADT